VTADGQDWADFPVPRGIPDKGLLDFLIGDAASRAASMLSGEGSAVEEPLVDAVRMLATSAGASHAAAAAGHTGMDAAELRRLAIAYTRGGPGGVAAAVGATPCGPDEMDAAVAEVRGRRTLAVGDLDVAPGSVTDEGAQVRIRLGPDGRWYPFTRARGDWWPADGAAPSAGAAYQAALRARSLRR
jgi:hypothetical protein